MSSIVATPVKACRACQSDKLDPVLDLGEQAISDFYPEPRQADCAPLGLVLCQDCQLAQLGHDVSRDRLFRQYWYRSGTQEAMVAQLADVAEHAQQLVRLEPGDVVVDIGANDGTLLRMFPETCTRIAFEPAKNLWNEAVASGNILVPGFFPDYWPIFLDQHRPKIITSIAMFYAVPEPAEFVQTIRDWLHPGGYWIVQLMDLESMIALDAFDNICHEHVTYWSPESFGKLIQRFGLELVDLTLNHSNGGSLRFVVRHARYPSVRTQVATKSDYWPQQLKRFAVRVEQNRAEVVGYLRRLRDEGSTVWGYGASTKGNTLLQYYGLTSDLVAKIADRQDGKWGRFTAGTNIEIASEEEMRAAKPDYLLVLPWHFAESFTKREHALLKAKTRLIVPLPSLRIITEHADASLSAQTASSVARA